MNVNDYRSSTSKKVERRLVLKKSVRKFINRCLIVIILFLGCLIMVKSNTSFKSKIIDYVYSDSFKFTKLRSIYEKYFGKILSADKVVPEEKKVFNEKISYNSANVYKDGVKLAVSSNYMVPTLESGIVVFMGEKEGYGNTIIIEQIDGIDVWYSNIKSNQVKMYDYVEKASMLGEVSGDTFYMVFQKDGNYLNYKDYI